MSSPGLSGSYSPYKNDALRVGQTVRITCEVSRYDGVIGTVFSIDEVSLYAIVEMPEGTGLRLESIKENRILKGLKKNSKKRRPRGDPQSFPIGWLVPIEPAGGGNA